MHTSAGIIIRNNDGEILMMDRAVYPYGWACPAGHLEEAETPEQAIVREAKEETGIDVIGYELLLEEFVEWNECVKGEKGHYWYLYETRNWEGKIKKSEKEAKDMQWQSLGNIKKLTLEPVWQYWFQKLEIT
jgi:mutator protein MutT